MKTDAKTMAEIWREIDINPLSEIQLLAVNNFWYEVDDFNFKPDIFLYRIKPKTIIVNGVEIPKPLSIEDLKNGNIYFFPALTLNLFDSCYRDWLTENQVKFIYKTKEEAIEASKKLFGIE